jgi:protein subunit release factor A
MPDFWARPEEAQDTLRQIREQERTLQTEQRLEELREELETFSELLKEEEPAEADAAAALAQAETFAAELELSVKMGTPEDPKNAWVMIHAGAPADVHALCGDTRLEGGADRPAGR